MREILSEKQMAFLVHGVEALVTLIIGFIAIKIILYLSKKLLEKSRLDHALHKFVLSSLNIFLWIILIIIVLTELNVPTVPLVTILGAGGAAIALALKDSLANVAAGIIILMTKPILKGETIEMENTKTIGVVDSIDLLSTHLNTFDNKKVLVPNNMITNTVVLNYSREGTRRVDCSFMINYANDIAMAKEILLNVAESCEEIMAKPEPIVGVAQQASDGIVIDLKAWCSSDQYIVVKYFLEENVKLAFDEAGIDIPFKQMEVKLRK